MLAFWPPRLELLGETSNVFVAAAGRGPLEDGELSEKLLMPAFLG